MALKMSMDPTGGIVSYVVIKIGELILREADLLGNTKDDLEWVQKQLETMQATLEDAATMEAMNERTRKCIKHLRELALRAEDVVDTLSLQLGNASTARSFFSGLAIRTRSRHNFGTEIKKLRGKVKDFKERNDTFWTRIPETAGITNEQPQPERLGAAPYVEYEDVVGLDRHVEAVTELMEVEGSRRSVVAIVGMDGLGKTTLARKIYNKLQSSFDCSAWVDATCGRNIPVLIRRIARDIINLSSEGEQQMKPDPLCSELEEFLKSKKYLIVLDDVRDSTTWRQLDRILLDGDKGSRIIITASRASVAANPKNRPMHAYHLPPLDEEEGRILFTKNASREGTREQCCPRDLEGLRDELVRKCRGLPIAIVVVGRLLSTIERTPRSWSAVSQKMNWERTTDEEQCTKILKLGYLNLPPHLRWCFLFLAALPEVCEVSAMLLKRLWIAEGFIQGQAGKSLEETAGEYLEELIQRGLVHAVERAGNGSTQVCRVHDLFLRLAISSARDLDFLDVWRSISEIRHGPLPPRLSLTCDRNREIGSLPLRSTKFRTLVVMDRKDWERRQNEEIEVENKIKWSKLKKNLELLRVLALGSGIKPLPEKLVYMLNLRYLELSGDEIKELPSSLGNLLHLQTLDVGRTGVRFLPKSTWQIRTLRYLHGSILSSGLPMPFNNPPNETFKELGALRSIRAGSWMDKILPMLQNLEELEIHRDSVDPIEEYLYSTIKDRAGLKVLILVQTKFSHKGRITFDMGKIFSGGDSHIYLHTLELSGFKVESLIDELPQSLRQVKFAHAKINQGIVELLGNLPRLHLLGLSELSFDKVEMIFESGWFPQLHVLSLHGLGIERWELVDQSLPTLRELEISRCSELQGLPGGLRHISTLKLLTLRGVPEEHMGEDRCYVRHIERVQIYP